MYMDDQVQSLNKRYFVIVFFGEGGGRGKPSAVNFGIVFWVHSIISPYTPVTNNIVTGWKALKSSD